ncbi:E3 ubiquitin-protein ligase NRDP1 [Halotydeus destructor]|nr:E3 ubiquitin-protein ligase NRDP1 [Halotydeus destructor]
MGFDTTRFEAIGDLEDDLTCPVCCGIFDGPVVTICGHTFCQECIVTWMTEENSCPVCRKLLYKLCRPPVAFMNILNRQRITCDQRSNGCSELIQLDRLSEHVKSCQHKPQQGKIRTFLKRLSKLNFRTTRERPKLEPVGEYDGESVPYSTRRTVRTTQVLRPRNTLLPRIAVVLSVMLLIVIVILCTKLSFSVIAYIFQMVAQFINLPTLRSAYHVMERLAFSALTFSLVLGFVFFVSSFMTIYNST